MIKRSVVSCLNFWAGVKVRSFDEDTLGTRGVGARRVRREDIRATVSTSNILVRPFRVERKHSWVRLNVAIALSMPCQLERRVSSSGVDAVKVVFKSVSQLKDDERSNFDAGFGR